MQRLSPFYITGVLAVVIFMSFYRLGSVTLFDVDEAVFAEATKEMVRSGDWITPTYNGENRYDKPILFYWLMAASYRMFGINEFGARFPSACAGILLSVALFYFMKRCIDEETALLAAISLVLSLYFIVYSHAAVTDMALTLFISLSLFFFFLSASTLAGPAEHAGRHLYGFYFFSALAFLTKGLIGIVFPFCVAAAFLLITKGYTAMGGLFRVRGIALFLLVSAPWYIAEFAVNGKEFFEQFFVKHHFMRYTGVISGHRGSFFYYIPALIIGLFPWVAFLPAGIRDALRECRAPVVPQKAPDEGAAAVHFPVRLFALIWLTVILLFFSFSTTKLPNYILPAVPAASILIAAGMAGLNGRWRRYAHGFISIAALSLGVAFVASRGYLVQFGVSDTGWTSAAAVIMCSLSAVSAYAFVSRRRPYRLMSALMIVFLLILSLKALPIANQKLQGTLYKYSLFARESLAKGDALITSGINNPSVVFYSDHLIKKADSPEELLPLMQKGRRCLIIAKSDNLENLKSLGLKLVSKDDKYALLETE
jgi:4-amino-4-deoxy-L-arabinose transferase-like glycosyltransferase